MPKTTASRTAAATASGHPARPPAGLNELRAMVEQRFDSLSDRLQAALRFLMDHPSQAAVDTIKSLAEHAGVQPSVMVRLAQALGYSGFSQMQAVFRDALLAQTQSYGERLRVGTAAKAQPPREAEGLLRLACDTAVESLQGLRDGGHAASLQQAIRLVAAARTVHVLGLRRAAPVANYLSYLLCRSRKVVRQMATMPGMLDDEVDALGPGALLVVISFQPFHPLAVQAQQDALSRGAQVLAVTDSSLSPLSKGAHGVLQVRDAEIAGFRSVVGAMVACQALAVGLATSNAPAKERTARPS